MIQYDIPIIYSYPSSTQCLQSIKKAHVSAFLALLCYLCSCYLSSLLFLLLWLQCVSKFAASNAENLYARNLNSFLCWLPIGFIYVHSEFWKHSFPIDLIDICIGSKSNMLRYGISRKLEILMQNIE